MKTLTIPQLNELLAKPAFVREPEITLDSEIDRLSREKGYPYIKLTYSEFNNVLKQAHKNVFAP